MRRILLGAAAVLLSAGPALATAVDADVTITSELAPDCHIVTYDDTIDLTTAAVNAWVYANFTYQCNYTGTPTLTFTSEHGGMLNDDDVVPDLIDYAIYLNNADGLASPASALQASNATGGTTYPPPIITTTVGPNTDKTPIFKVAKRSPGLIAGVYEDTLTIAIAP